MTLLREIQSAATNENVDVATLLRKAKILAARLKNIDFQEWVNNELNGYPDPLTLPSYRVIPAAARAHLATVFQQFNNAPVNTSFLPSEWKDLGGLARFTDPISTLAQLAATSDDDLRCPWPQEIATAYGAKGYDKRVYCLGAWLVVPPAALAGVVDSVKTKLLDFVLQIESENPGAGEAAPNEEPIPQERLKLIVNNTFNGPVGNVAQHSTNFTQNADIGMPKEDLRRLVEEVTAHLSELKLDAQQTARVTQQLVVLRTEIEASNPDPGIVYQAGRTIRSLTEGVIGNFIASAAQPTVWLWVQGVLEHFK
ncbi:MAG: hypothetical protein JNK87_41400 [Bryobacterales bacterium]|nr:hypothetical protein [Bryobacterales bacterium]